MAGKYRNMPYHICYESSNLENDLRRLEGKGYIVIQKPEVAPAIKNNKVAFLMHLYVGIIELVEKN
jgi:methylmalonyl-CoA/ethylmalonyl-CoA epimerase